MKIFYIKTNEVLDALQRPENNYPRPASGKIYYCLTYIFTIFKFNAFTMSFFSLSYYFFLLGGYFFVDSGYPYTLGFQPSYCTERYHLWDFRGGDCPEGAKELFNYRHSSLCNVIERCFGILKARFPVLKMMSCYKPCRQGNVMRACCTIHNVIWMATRNDRLFTQFNIDYLTIKGEGMNNLGEPSYTVDLIDQVAKAMSTYRDQIARLMLTNNRHHWCHVKFFLGWNWFPGIDAIL